MLNRIFSESFFRKTGTLTVLSVFFVIFLGGFVRTTGSGMGCPDWPKCFGQWVPPTDVSQLPADYREIYKKPGHEVAEFNVVKTYIEYVNRLFGAITGMLMLLTVISSFQFRKKSVHITLLTVLAFLLTGLQGWIGARVVATNLAGWMITIHMLLALVIVTVIMIPVYQKSSSEAASSISGDHSTLKVIICLAIALTFFQIGIGTQVRELIDKIGLSLMKSVSSSNFEELLGNSLKSHKLISVLVLLVNVLLFYKIRKNIKGSNPIKTAALAILVLIIIQIITGTLNVYYQLPGYSQVLHIVISTIIYGYQVYIGIGLLIENSQNKPVEAKPFNPALI